MFSTRRCGGTTAGRLSVSALAAALALHLGVAAGLLAWPRRPPPAETEAVVELAMVPPPPPVAAPAPAPAPAVVPPPLPAPVPRPGPRPVAAPRRARRPAAPAPAASAAPATMAVPAAEVAPAPPAVAAVAITEDAAPLTMVPPVYPPLARRHGWQGVVMLLVEVSAAGDPVAVTVQASSGHPALDQAAAEAARLWHFHPARRAGIAVAVPVRVPVRFSLGDG